MHDTTCQPDLEFMQSTPIRNRQLPRRKVIVETGHGGDVQLGVVLYSPVRERKLGPVSGWQ